MPTPSLIEPGQVVHDIALLKLLRGRRLCEGLRTLGVIGAHRLDELPLINKVFPALQRIFVFEPLPGPLQVLRQLAAQDGRITVFPFAVADRDGEADFHVTSNDGESSSLLAFGSHQDHFPDVQVRSTIRVGTRRIDSLLAEQGLPAPDVVIIDVQGAELQVLQSFGPALRDLVRLIYTEVSREAVYTGSGLLSDVEALLSPRFVNLGFASINADVPAHGNAVFVAQPDVDAAIAFTLAGRLRHAVRRAQERRRTGRQRQARQTARWSGAAGG